MTQVLVGFQLFSARKFPPVEEQLKSLAAMGYRAVEPYDGNFGNDPRTFRAKADAYGLVIPSAQIPLTLLDEDRKRFSETALLLGARTAVLPYMAPEDRPATSDGWRSLAARLGEHAAHLRDLGLNLAWHNHDFEFVRLRDGTRPIDHLLAVDGMMAEADIGWMVRAGADPVIELTRYSSKIAALHIKDTAQAGVAAEDGWTDLGAGIIDWRAIWPAIEQCGCRLLIVEHDNPSDWRSFADKSLGYLRRLTGQSVVTEA
jgi:sugar phosphate isomerase/epimerase